MKTLTCEICGGTEILKQDGVFVCQECGTKYTVEEVRNLLGENANNGAGGRNSAVIENYLQLASNAMESSNNEEAENYANKVIELDSKNALAWEIKGEAAGWQSKTINNRIPEAVVAWINAVGYAKEEDVKALTERIADKYSRLFRAMVSLHAGNFKTLQTDENKDAIVNAVNSGVEMMNTLVINAKVSFNRAVIYENIASMLNGSAVDGYNDAEKDFGPEHHNMQKWQWERFTGACDNCIEILKLALQYVRSDSLGKTICDNIIFIEAEARDSKSWTFNVNSWNADHYDVDYTFTQEAKNARTKIIDEHKKIKKRFETSLAEKTEKELTKMLKTEMEDMAKKKYWEEHSEEKQKLESEKSEKEKEMAKYNSEIEGYEAEIEKIEAVLKDRVPADDVKDEIETKILSLNNEKESLGLFKFKEKNLVQGKIDVEKEKLANIDKVIEEQKKAIADKVAEDVSAIKAKKDGVAVKKEGILTEIAKINDELSKSRGSIETTGRYAIEGATKDGKFAFTKEALLEKIGFAVGDRYSASKFVEDICKIGGNLGKCWRTRITDPNKGGDNKNTGIDIIVEMNADTETIERIFVEYKGSFTDEKSAAAWADVASAVLMIIEAGISKENAEKIFLNLVFSDSSSWYGEGNTSIEFADYNFLLGIKCSTAVIKHNL